MQIDTSQNSKLTNPLNPFPGPSRERIWLMFDRIAGRYDLLNHLLSFGFDLYWRKKMTCYLPVAKELTLLDLATGTGDQLIAIMNNSDCVQQVIGVDMSEQMLQIAGEKVAKYSWCSRVKLISGAADKINFPDNTFDIITISFGIRNFIDLQLWLTELRRVLKPAGVLLILEFSLPRNLIMRRLHLFYLRRVLPLAGKIISGDDYAYRYLNETIETFPSGELFCSALTQGGFKQVMARPLTCGIVTIYRGEK
jgi:demethylmenaquinone methyltransferase/2-methoxy-6-polyprenyl-1,4-benzoquinol methylase